MRKERALNDERPDFRQIDDHTVEYRGQKFTLRNATVHTGHQGMDLEQRKKRLTLMALE